MLGMNILHPEALQFHPDSSPSDTLNACTKYNIKPPHLNADLFATWLKKTNMNVQLQKDLVRGWREGFILGSNILNENHIVGCPPMDEHQETVLENSIKKESELRRLGGPYKKPIEDGRRFTNA